MQTSTPALRHITGCLLCACWLLGCGGAPAEPAPTAPALPPLAAAPAEAAPTPPPKPPRFMIVEHAQRPAVRTPDGCVVLELDRQWHSLRYRRGPEPSCARFEDSLTLLHDMLMTLAASGELANATSLDLGRDYTAFYRRLAIAAARSKAWDAQRGKPVTGNANAFVVATAADPATFFPEVVTLLQDTGLRAELRSVEKVLAGTPSDTPFAAELLAAGATPKAKLPHDCIVAFHLEPSK